MDTMDPFNTYPVPDDFWNYSWYDAHCHPTDTLSTLSSIPNLQTRKITIQSTRFSDQAHVKQTAENYPDKVIPAFGLHPWFSHLLYDDNDPNLKDLEPSELKKKHYQSCLQPVPDEDFTKDLPDPKPLSEFLSELRSNLQAHPHALVGEIGMDKAFRIPINWAGSGLSEEPDTPSGSRGQRKLSPFRTSPAQQKAVFQAQLRVAGEFGRAVSVHSVKSHGAIFDTLRELWKGWEIRVESNREKRLRSKKGIGFIAEYDSEDSEWDSEGEDSEGEKKFPEQPRQGVRPYPPRILIHSCSAPEIAVKQFLGRPSSTHIYPSELFFSFSTTINCKHMDHLEAVIKTVAENCVMVESDLHTAGSQMDAAISQAAILVCKTRGWTLEEGSRRMERNWERYVYGRQPRKKEED